MINVHFVYLGAAINLAGASLYIRDTVRGTTRPNRVTWLLWGLAPLLAFAVEYDEGVGLRSLMTFMVGFIPLVIFGASFVNPRAVWQIGRFDYACGALSILGTAVWLITRAGIVAIAAAIAADLLAGLPTLVKSWKEPHSETAWGYLGATINAVITLLTITTVSVAVLAFPLYIAVIGSVEVFLVLGRPGPRWRSRRQRRAPHSALPTT